MSDLMFYGVLRMPYEMAMSDDLSRLQFYDRVQEAVERLQAAEKEVAELRAALQAQQGDALRAAETGLEAMLKQFTRTPSTLEDTNARGKAHAALKVVKAALAARGEG